VLLFKARKGAGVPKVAQPPHCMQALRVLAPRLTGAV
jgi:hypothetical protein